MPTFPEDRLPFRLMPVLPGGPAGSPAAALTPGMTGDREPGPAPGWNTAPGDGPGGPAGPETGGRTGSPAGHEAGREPGIELRGLSYRYGGLKVLEDISFFIPPGRSLAILGPSGCGKSTLLHIAAGLLVPDEGDVLFNGASRLGRPGWISYMQQDDLLFPWKTVEDNIALPLRLQGTGKQAARLRVREKLADFGLQGFGRHFPHQLSGGMKQRAAFMRSCMLRQDYLLLDEPFSRLDYLTRSRMHLWFQDYLAAHESGVLLVTHDPQEALLLADEILVLSARPARILERYTIEEPRPRSSDFLSRPATRRLLESIVAQATRFT